MKGNFSQQKFSRSHFLMHSSRFVPLRWHCSCCQSVKGNVRFHLSTMAWPCVLSWSRVAKAISWERRVDYCPFEVSSQNEEQNWHRIKISSRSKTTRNVETNPGMVPVWWMLLCFVAVGNFIRNDVLSPGMMSIGCQYGSQPSRALPAAHLAPIATSVHQHQLHDEHATTLLRTSIYYQLISPVDLDFPLKSKRNVEKYWFRI